MPWKGFLILAMAVVLLSGCTTLPENPLRGGKDDLVTMNEIMARRDRIVHLTSLEKDDGKPVLLLVHGATADPTEMMDIVQEWRGKYDVYLFAYNYHRPVRTVALDFVVEIEAVDGACIAAALEDETEQRQRQTHADARRRAGRENG